MRNIGKTNSNDSVSIYIPEEKTLFVGDADCEDHFKEYHFDNIRRGIF